MRGKVLAAATAAFVLASPAQAAGAQQRHATGSTSTRRSCRRISSAPWPTRGSSSTEARDVAGGTEVQLVLSKGQRAQLARDGIKTTLTRVKGGKTVKEFAAEQSENGFNVWRSWDEPGGFRDQMHAAARDNRGIAKLVPLGTTYQGRELLALKLTAGARGLRDGRRPAVLYSSTQHAREWIANEVNRRLMNWYIDRWRAEDPEIKQLLETTELWFILVANPDGYEYTFDVERLWRKNLRDNNGDGQITIGDGVDPNRNFPNHFKYDEEGRPRSRRATRTAARRRCPSPRRWR